MCESTRNLGQDLLPAIVVLCEFIRPAPDDATARWFRSGPLLVQKLPVYFWAADGNWYEVVSPRQVGKVSWWHRFFDADDLIVADFELRKLDKQPITNTKLYDLLLTVAALGVTAWKNEERAAQKKAAKLELKACKTQPEVYAWVDKHFPVRLRYPIDPGKRKKQ